MDDGYPSDWDSRRKMVYRRDDYRCQNCGSGGGPNGRTELHAHHIVPKSEGGSHQLSNLKTVCKGCHDSIHGHSTSSDTTSSTSGSGAEEFPPIITLGFGLGIFLGAYVAVGMGNIGLVIFWIVFFICFFGSVVVHGLIQSLIRKGY